MAEVRPTIFYSDLPKSFSAPYPIYLVSVGHFNSQPNETRSDKEYHEFHWITKGSGIYHIGNEDIKVSKGMCIFMRSGFDCHYEPANEDEPFSTSWVGFLGGDELLNFYNLQEYKIFKSPQNIDIFQSKVIEACKNKTSESRRSVACYNFLAEILEAMYLQDRDIADLVKYYISQNFARNITLEEVASEIGITKFSLCRYLKSKNEDTFVNQLKDVRIQNAKSVLETTSLSATQVSIFCGFESPSYFGKIFKEKTGLTPQEYRKIYSKGIK